MRVKKDVIAKFEKGVFEYKGEGIDIKKEVEEYVRKWKEKRNIE